jgi:hypothetical protein
LKVSKFQNFKHRHLAKCFGWIFLFLYNGRGHVMVMDQRKVLGTMIQVCFIIGKKPKGYGTGYV